MLTQEKTAAPHAKPRMQFGCLSVLLNLIWIGLLAGGLYYAYGSYKLITGGNSVAGTVAQMIISNDDDGVSYAPLIQYEADGNAYTYESHNYSNPPAYHVGQAVKMLYDRDHPDKARISSFLDLWLLPAILIPFGVGLAAVTLFLMPMRSRRKAA